MTSNKRALVCCTDDQRCRAFVRSVLEDCDREGDDGTDMDDRENGCFSVSHDDSVSENGDDDSEPEETRNIGPTFRS